MKIYHFNGAGSESERFFIKSLTDYIDKSGLKIPSPVFREGVKFKKGPHGKPYFKAPELGRIFFSRSHSKGHEVLCFSEREIGVDCENIEERPGIGERYKKIAGRCFTEDEQAYIEEEEDSIVRFFEIWTAKEAYMKYTGKGFSEGFRTFSVLRVQGVDIVTSRLSAAPNVICSVCTARADV